MSDIFDKRAADAYTRLVSKDEPSLTSPKASDKALFAELVTAGLRLITSDQTGQTLRNNDLLAAVRCKRSQDALTILMQLNSDSMHSHDTCDDTLNTAADELVTKESTLVSEVNEDDEKGITSSELVQSILSKRIEYQVASSAYTPNLPNAFSAKNSSYRSHVIPANSSAKSLIEAELSADLLKAIEAREHVLSRLKIESAKAQRKHIMDVEPFYSLSVTDSSEHSSQHQYLPYHPSGVDSAVYEYLVDRYSGNTSKAKNLYLLSATLQIMQQLRDSTIQVFEQLGAWLRYCKSNIHSEIASSTSQDGGYCVFIATKGSILYNSSQPVVSRTKKFSRDLEPLKYEVKVNYIGVYSTKNEGVHAFDDAYRCFPLEKRLNPSQNSVNMIVSKRKCGKHFIIKCQNCVMKDECEICKTDQLCLFNATIQQQFVWQGVNYMEKMCSDVSFLEENLPFTEIFPLFMSENNPLLLPDFSCIQSLLSDVLSNTSSMALQYDPLLTFENKTEKLQKAKNYSKELQNTLYNQSLLKTSPYNTTTYDTRLMNTVVKIKNKQLNLLFAPFPPPPPSAMSGFMHNYQHFDFLNADMYKNIRTDDSRLFRAQSIYSLYCSHARITYDEAMRNSIKSGVIEGEFIDKSASTGLVPIVAIYEQSGIHFKSVQYRANISHREENVFCKSEAGEWASIHTKGRHVRSYEFKQLFYLNGQKFLAAKKFYKSALISLLSTDMFSLDYDQASVLLDEAKQIKGGYLNDLIFKFEKYLKVYVNAIHSIVRIQAMFRSYTIRIRQKRILLALNSRQQHLLHTFSIVNKVAIQKVSSLLRTAVFNQIKAKSRPVFKFACNYSGNRVVVCVGLGVSYGGVESWRISVYNPCNLTKYVCTTTANIEESNESRLIQLLQNKSNAATTVKHLDHADLTCLLSTVMRTSLDFEAHASSSLLQGDSYGKISPLFRNDCNNSNYAGSASCDIYDILIARMYASKESSTLFTIPRHISPTVQNKIVNMDVQPWSPIFDITSTKRHCEEVSAKNLLLKNMLEVANKEMCESEEKLCIHSHTTHEWCSMELEDSCGILYMLHEQLEKADLRVAKVMQTSKEMLSIYEAEVSKRKYDDAQAWEELEYASGWKHLNKSRKISKRIISEVEMLRSRRVQLDECCELHVKLKLEIEKCRQNAIMCQKNYDDFQAVVGEVRLRAISTKQVALEASKIVASCLSIHTLQNHKILRHIDVNFIHIRDACKRCHTQYRNNLTLVNSISLYKLLNINYNTIHNDENDATQVRIYFEELFGYFVIECSDVHTFFEESSFYEDFGLEKEDEIAQNQRDNEVFISPSQLLSLVANKCMKRCAAVAVSSIESCGSIENDVRSIRESVGRILSEYIQISEHNSNNNNCKFYSTRVHQRRKDLNFISNYLFSQIKVHTFSKRLCIDVLSVQIRTQLLQNTFNMSNSHYKHTIAKSGNRLLHKLLYTMWNKAMFIHVYFDGTIFTISSPQSMKNDAFYVTFTLSSAIVAMSTSFPYLLSAFVNEIIIEKLSQNTIRFLLSCINTHTIDTYQKHWWRQNFQNERLTFSFDVSNSTNSDLINQHSIFEFPRLSHLFRGPIYTTVRVFDEMYFKVKIYTNSFQDVRMLFTCVDAYTYPGTYYSNSKIECILLTRSEIIKFLLQSSLNKFEILLLLHTDNKAQLYEYILNCISVVRSEVLNNGNSLMANNRLTELKFVQLFSAFKNWVNKCRLPAQSTLNINNSLHSALEQSIHTLYGNKLQSCVVLNESVNTCVKCGNWVTTMRGRKIVPRNSSAYAFSIQTHLSEDSIRIRTYVCTSLQSATSNTDVNEEIGECYERKCMARENALSVELSKWPTSRDEQEDRDGSEGSDSDSMAADGVNTADIHHSTDFTSLRASTLFTSVTVLWIETVFGSYSPRIHVPRDANAYVSNETYVIGCVFPIDAQIEIIVFEFNTNKWRDMCKCVLSDDCVQSEVSPSCIEYFSANSPSIQNNTRLYSWNQYYRSISDSSSAKHSYKIECRNGTVLCMFRKTSRLILQIFNEWCLLYTQQMQLVRREEMNVILQHHQLYTQNISKICACFEFSFYLMFGCVYKQEVCVQYVASVLQTRQLITQFYNVLMHDSKDVFSLHYYDEEHVYSGAMHECYVVYQSDNNTHIDSSCIESYLHGDSKYSAQIVYEIFIRHIEKCTCPNQFCRFPGCSHVKQYLSEKDGSNKVLIRNAIQKYVQSEMCRRLLRRYTVDRSFTCTDSGVNTRGDKSVDGNYCMDSYKEVATNASFYSELHEKTKKLVTQRTASYDSCINDQKDGNIYMFLDTIPSHVINNMYSAIECDNYSYWKEYISNESFEFQTVGYVRSNTEVHKRIWLMDRLICLNDSEERDYCYLFNRHFSSALLFLSGIQFSIEILYGVLDDSSANSLATQAMIPTIFLQYIVPGLCIIFKSNEYSIQHVVCMRENGYELEQLKQHFSIDSSTSTMSYIDMANKIISHASQLFTFQFLHGRCSILKFCIHNPQQYVTKKMLQNKGQTVQAPKFLAKF